MSIESIRLHAESIFLSKKHLFEKVWDVTWILLIATVTLLIKIGNPNLRMATASSDDNPISIGNYLLNPNNYKNDIYLQYLGDYGSHSIYNLSAYLALKLSVPSVVVWEFLVVCQVILILVAMSMLLKMFQVDFKFRPQFLLFVMIYQPYFWNLGGIGLDLQPYAFTLAIPISIFVLIAIMKERYLLCGSLVFLTTLIHPTFGAIVLMFCLTFILLKMKSIRITEQAVYLIPSLLLIVIQLVLFTERNTQLPKEWQNYIYDNGHLNFYNPLKSFSGNLTVIYWIYIVSLSLISYIICKLNKTSNRMIALKSLVVTSIFGLLLNQLAITFHISAIANLLGVRLTSTLVLFTLVILFSQLTQLKLLDRNEKTVVKLFYIFPHPLFLIQFIALYLFKKRWTVLAFYASSIILTYGLLVRFTQSIDLPFTSQFVFVQKFIDLSTLNIGTSLVSTILLHDSAKILSVGILFVICIAWIEKIPFDFKLVRRKRTDMSILSSMKNEQVYALLATTLFVFCAIFGFKYAYQFSFNSNEWSLKQVNDLSNAQKWANTETPVDSSFIVAPNEPFLPWRTQSNRSSIPLGKVIGAYGYYPYMSKFNLELTRFFAKYPDKMEISPERLCEFREIFGGDYIVEPTDTPRFTQSTEVKFINDSWTIGKINCAK